MPCLALKGVETGPEDLSTKKELESKLLKWGYIGGF